ncbi:MAG: hypothetical protein ACLTL2_20060 [Blautia sp.]|uniref:hypothetical protein n=1 Tax=Blautia sp. TaxID=1955243 RepID=UPI0039919800
MSEEEIGLLQQILAEMKTLNTNFDAYTTYINDRDTAILQEKEAEKNQAEMQEISDTAQDAGNPYDEPLANIQTILSRVDENLKIVSTAETVDYTESIKTIQSTQENVEYNTSFLVSMEFAVIAGIYIIAAFLLGRIFFRKI